MYKLRIPLENNCRLLIKENKSNLLVSIRFSLGNNNMVIKITTVK